VRAAIATTLALLAAATAGCGDDSRERDAVLRVVDRARDALAAGRAHDFCALLTPHGRARSLEFRVDFDHDGGLPPSSPRVPQTCEQIVDRERRLDRGEHGFFDAARTATFRVRELGDSRATVRGHARGGSYETTLRLRKTAAGWRIDDSSGIPTGH
jgi:hypothetical protein